MSPCKRPRAGPWYDPYHLRGPAPAGSLDARYRYARAMASSNSSESSTPAEVARPLRQRAGPAGACSGAEAGRKVRIHHLQQAKQDGTRFAMLTAYEQYTAEIFDDAGIEVLLVGDSASNNVFGNETSLPVTVDELLPLCRAVARVPPNAPWWWPTCPSAATRSPRNRQWPPASGSSRKAWRTPSRSRAAPTTPTPSRPWSRPASRSWPTSVSRRRANTALGGYRVQGRGDDAQRLIDDAVALADAGAFSVLMEMVPAETAAAVDAAVAVPTVGIGAGKETTGQVLVWQDMAGLRGGRMAKFVKQYADLRTTLLDAATAYGEDVRSGQFPGPEHSF